MFDDLQNQNQPNPQNGAPAQGGFGNNQNQFQNQTPPQAQPSQASGLDQPRYQTMPKEDFNQRIERLNSSGANQSGGKKMYAAIGAIVILLLAGGGAFAGYHYWPEIIAGINKLTGKQVEQVPSGDNSGINNQNQTNENAANNQDLVLNVEWKNCAVDADCAETQAGCCSCNNGGTQTAINLNSLSQWQSLISEKCKDMGCATIAVCKNGQAVCENGQCVFKENLESAGASSTESMASTTGSTELPATGENSAVNSQDISKDTDGDGLTDVDEARYGTDSKNPDSDGDGYSDGAEVKNGYNPLGEGKLK